MTLNELKLNDWFFDDSGKLCQVTDVDEEGYYKFTDGYFETASYGKTCEVYPLTIHNKVIAEEIRNYYDKFHDANILTPKTSGCLREYYIELMSIGPEGKGEDYRSIYKRIDEYMADLKYHMSYFK